MESSSAKHDQHGVNGASGAAAAGFDPAAYRTAPEAEAGAGAAPGAEAATTPAVPWPDEKLAGMAAYLASAGIKDAEELKAFREKHAEDLRKLYEHVGFGEALAEFGLTMYGDGKPMPAWMAALTGVGGTAVLTLMARPELLQRILAVLQRRGGGSDGATSWTDDGGGPGGAGAAGEGTSDAEES